MPGPAIKDLKEKLLPVFEKYKVSIAYLFGSRAKGEAYETSDYDIACLFKPSDFKADDLGFSIHLQMELEEALAPAEVDLVMLNKAPIVLRYEVIAPGIILYCIDDDFRTDFEDIVVRDYLDFKPFLDQYDREAFEAIKGGHFFA